MRLIARPVAWVNLVARRWWPIVASLAAGALLYTLWFVVATVAEERDTLRSQNEQLTAQNERLTSQSEQLAVIIERNERLDSSRQERFASALASAEALLVDQFAQHDQNVALKLNELLHRIASLLDRPAPADPIQHQPAPAPQQQAAPAPRPGGTQAAPAPTAPAPPPTTTTTTPDQKGCAKRPGGHPRC